LQTRASDLFAGGRTLSVPHLEEYQDVGEEEEEEDDVEEEGIEEEELVSSYDMEHSVIVVAPRC
jgi:hypothetical protein